MSQIHNDELMITCYDKNIAIALQYNVRENLYPVTKEVTVRFKVTTI